MRTTDQETQLRYKAFEVAMCMLEELRDRGIDACTLAEGERMLGMATDTLAREPSRIEFKHFPRGRRAQGYALARKLADLLLAES